MAKNKNKNKTTVVVKTTDVVKTDNKKVLVTGGLGLIGHNVVAKLQAAGHEVQIIDVLTTYNSIDKAELEYLYNERLKKIDKETPIYKLDICDSSVNEVFELFKPDYVIHLASFPREKAVKNNPVDAAHTMGEGLINVLECCASSSMVYGDFEDDVAEDAVLKPQGAYAIWKVAGEQIMREYKRSKNLDYIIVRPSAVYGPLDVGDRVISMFLISAMKDNTLNVNGANEKLDFTYVDDAADGIIAATFSDHVGTYNLTKSHSCTLESAANLAVKLAGKGLVSIREKDEDFPSRGALNIDAARRDFGFDPKVDIEEGFQIYYKWLSNSVYWANKH
jgi:nucleoside-diphosphate-sugar epimerase